MITTTQKYKQELIAGNRRYVVKAELTLADNTSLTLTNQELWDQGVVLDNAISSDNSFDIGAAIVGSLTLVIDNISGDYNVYDFANAKVVLYLGVENDVDLNDDQIYYRIGFYSVDETSYNGTLITLDCLDNMTWFDTPFSGLTGLVYPTTAGQLVADICSHVGVTLGTVTFQNYTMAISEESGEWLAKNNVNCREVLQYVAQKCCCYCKINTAGELVLKWYNKDEINNIVNWDGGTYHTTTTPYSDGCDLDGGSFDPWNAGDSADGGTFADLQNGAWLTQNFEMNVSTEEIVVTGCRVRSTSGQNQYDELWVDTTLEQTHERYVLVIENNPLITATEAASVANVIGSILANLPLRAFDSRSLSDFSYETGDMVTIIDFRGNLYYTWITNLTFTINNSENFSCGAQSIKKRNETRFSEAAKTLAEANENASAKLTEYENAQAALNELAQNALDYYKYEHTVTGSGMTTWLHNGPTEDTTTYSDERPLFPDSSNVIKISGDGVFLSHDHGETYPLGLDANSGAAILNMIYAHGINCDWIHAGTLTLGGYNNEDGQCAVLDALGNTKVHLDNTGIKVYGGSIEGTSFKQESGNDKVSIASGKIMTQGTWIQLCQDISNPDLKHFALGYSQSAYMDNTISPPYFKQIDSKNIIEAGDHYSDERLKTDIEPINDDVVKELVLNASIKQFKRTDEPKKQRYGVIAQAVRKQLDDVGLDKENVKLTSEDSRGYYQIEYREYIPMLMRTVQIQQEQIDLLKKELAELKAKVK